MEDKTDSGVRIVCALVCLMLFGLIIAAYVSLSNGRAASHEAKAEVEIETTDNMDHFAELAKQMAEYRSAIVGWTKEHVEIEVLESIDLVGLRMTQVQEGRIDGTLAQDIDISPSLFAGSYGDGSGEGSLSGFYRNEEYYLYYYKNERGDYNTGKIPVEGTSLAELKEGNPRIETRKETYQQEPILRDDYDGWVPPPNIANKIGQTETYTCIYLPKEYIEKIFDYSPVN